MNRAYNLMFISQSIGEAKKIALKINKKTKAPMSQLVNEMASNKCAVFCGRE